MSHLKILILETNELTQLTINSIRKNMPRTKFQVVKCGKSKIGTALSVCTEPTLVVTSGVVVDIKHGDLPSIDTINNYAICASRTGVYADHNRHKEEYKLLDINMTMGHIDLSVFIINPAKWYEVPASDVRVLNDKKILYMPRYMNHKTDPLVNTCIGAYEAFAYGMRGEDAAIYNYVPHLLSGKASVMETMAYNFDKFEEYTEGLNPRVRQNILKLAEKSKVRVSKMRRRLYNLNKDLATKSPA